MSGCPDIRAHISRARMLLRRESRKCLREASGGHKANGISQPAVQLWLFALYSVQSNLPWARAVWEQLTGVQLARLRAACRKGALAAAQAESAEYMVSSHVTWQECARGSAGGTAAASRCDPRVRIWGLAGGCPCCFPSVNLVLSFEPSCAWLSMPSFVTLFTTPQRATQPNDT